MMPKDGSPANETANKSPPKIMFLIAEDWYFLSHRLPLARACRDRGWDVVVATRIERHGDAIRNEGFRVIPIRMRRTSRGPMAELATIYELISIFAREKPDIVHQVGLKPVIYGSLAAMVTRTGLVVNALAGLGYIFTSGRLSISMSGGSKAFWPRPVSQSPCLSCSPPAG